MGRREDLAAADAKRRAKARRRQWAAGNRRGLRRDGSVGGREDMALGGSGPGAENSVWEGVAPRAQHALLCRESPLLRTSDVISNRRPPWLLFLLLPTMWAPDSDR